MHIKQILWQNRRDFSAIFACQHCGATQTQNGYDDSFFHHTVIPEMLCLKCGKKAPSTYRPHKPKFSDDFVI